jgi:hypothetical protein
MAETRQIRPQKKKKSRKEDETSSAAATTDKTKKLKQLDDFIEGVLQEAGEEFLEEFKQVEGE